jgi:hypothetical protein
MGTYAATTNVGNKNPHTSASSGLTYISYTHWHLPSHVLSHLAAGDGRRGDKCCNILVRLQKLDWISNTRIAPLLEFDLKLAHTWPDYGS